MDERRCTKLEERDRGDVAVVDASSWYAASTVFIVSVVHTES
jgi:hypothetical protein